MADSAKREKIAAARKKLKQFKQKTGRNSPANQKSSTKQPTDKKLSSNSELLPTIDNEDTFPTNTEVIQNSINNLEQNNKSYSNSFTAFSPTVDDQSHLTSFAASSGPYRTSHSYRVQSPVLTMDRPTASTESLHQLSRQLNGMLAESSALADGHDVDNSNVAELERRNRELASLLEKHSEANEQLNNQIVQIREHAKNLQEQLERERDTFSEKQRQDIGPLKEQLQVHIQTIGILVAEKTELQSQLNQSQKIGEQRFNEIEELSGRLKASRQRVADLERNLSSSNNSSQQFEKSSKEYAKDVDRLKLDLYKANKSQEELKQQSLELAEKFNAKVSECSGLEQSVEDLKKRLEMAELYAQQVSSQSDNNQESLQLVEQLQRDKEQLVIKVQEYTEAFQKVSVERDQLADQYKQYVDQLQQHGQQLAQQVTSLTEERETLVNRQHELEAAVLELQRRLEDFSEQAQQNETSLIDNSQKEKEIENLHKEHNDLVRRHEAQIRDNAQLSRFLEEKEERITDLENQVSEMGQVTGDREQLLENIQSDKTALSRALSQNKELKNQLAELQSGFVKLSNDNMELMTKVQSEQHSSKELICRLGQQEDEIKNLKEGLSQKDSMLLELQSTNHEAKKEMYQQEQMQDRLRHYEAQAQLVETLQRELQNAQDMVDALKTQNSELRTMLIKASDSHSHSSLNPEDEQKRDDVIESLTTAIKQLETERNQLIQTLKEQRDLCDSLSVKVSDLEQAVVQKSTFHTDNDKISRAEYEQLRTAMEMVENKYMSVMKDKADLSDKAEELEHIVLQLQGETDTIGEYISLYHHQRALLQQRESQKNEYIAHLAKDREELQEKLGELQQLVMQLLGEKNMLHNYHEEANTSLHSNDLSIQPHLPATQTAMVNGTSPGEADWPDYTSSESDTESEVEAIIGGQDTPSINNLAPETDTVKIMAVDNSIDKQTHTKNHRHHHYHHHHHNHQHPHSQQEDQTANKILNLLTQIGHSNLVDHTDSVDHNFLPCKYCKGQVQII